MKKVFFVLFFLFSISAQADWIAEIRVKEMNCTGTQIDMRGFETVGPVPHKTTVRLAGATLADNSYSGTLTYAVDGGPAVGITSKKIISTIGAMIGVGFQLHTIEGNFNLGSDDPEFAKFAADGNVETLRSFKSVLMLPAQSGATFLAFDGACTATFLKYCEGSFDNGLCDKIKK